MWCVNCNVEFISCIVYFRDFVQSQSSISWHCVQWNLDTSGAEESVIVSEVSSFQGLKE